MKGIVATSLGLCVALAAFGAAAAAKPPAKTAAGKAPPACAAIVFRALPSTAGEGDQEAGMYRSRFGRLSLHATLKGGQASEYFVVANGKRIAAASELPPSAVSCAEKKQMPKPENPLSACTGDKFTVVIHHAGETRLALLYALAGNSWHFCSAGSY
jgi:hypothetical protein